MININPKLGADAVDQVSDDALIRAIESCKGDIVDISKVNFSKELTEADMKADYDTTPAKSRYHAMCMLMAYEGRK